MDPDFESREIVAEVDDVRIQQGHAAILRSAVEMEKSERKPDWDNLREECYPFALMTRCNEQSATDAVDNWERLNMVIDYCS